MTPRRFLVVLFLFVASLFSAYAADAPKPPHVFFLIGEPEYKTKTTVPAFAKAELEPRGVQCTFSILPSDDSNDFPNIDALKDADLLFISVRRHTPIQAEMDAIRAYVKAGKPVVGIRTASHAFALRGKDAKPAAGFADWPEFDHEILGGNYSDHYGHDLETWGKVVPAQAHHPVVADIKPDEFKIASHLYKNPDLPSWVTPLMTARIDVKGQSETQPIAWVNTKDNRRIFYTSLGAPEDFELPQFKKLLLNAVFWAMGRPVPAPGATGQLRPGP